MPRFVTYSLLICLSWQPKGVAGPNESVSPAAGAEIAPADCYRTLGETLERHVFQSVRPLTAVAKGSPERLKALRNLTDDDAVLDYGCGEGVFLEQMASPAFQDKRKELGILAAPKLVGVTYKMEREPSSVEKEGKVHILNGKKTNEWKDENFTQWTGKFKLVIDEYGVISYTTDLSGDLNQIARIVQPHAVVSLTGKFSEAATSILTKEGRVIPLSKYIASQPGVRVLDEGYGNIDFEIIGEQPVVFPDLHLLYGNERTPPERLFVEGDLNNWTVPQREVAIKNLRDSQFVRGQLGDWTRLSRLVFENTLDGPYGEFKKFTDAGERALERFEQVGISRTELLRPQNVYGLYLALLQSRKKTEAQGVLTKYSEILRSDPSPLRDYILVLNGFVSGQPDSTLQQSLSNRIRSSGTGGGISEGTLAIALLGRDPIDQLISKSGIPETWFQDNDNSALLTTAYGLWGAWNSNPEAKSWLREQVSVPRRN